MERTLMKRMLFPVLTCLLSVPGLLSAQDGKKAAAASVSQALSAKVMNAAGEKQRLALAIQQIQLQAQLLEKQLQEVQKSYSEADEKVKASLDALMKACGASREDHEIQADLIRAASEGSVVPCSEAFVPKEKK